MKILNNKNIYKILITILAITSSGCLNKKKINNLNIKKKTRWNYDIGIEGIECKICAYKTVKRLEKLDDVDNVKMICTPNFRECHANLEYSNITQNINIFAIHQAIENEGFELKYISGNFIGTFDDKLDKFNLLSTGIPTHSMRSAYSEQSENRSKNSTVSAIASGDGRIEGLQIKFMNPNENNFVLPINQKITVDAKLIFQKKLNEIWMTLN